MKLCKHCKEFLDLFNSEFRPEKFWFGNMKTCDYCIQQFLDEDDRVKSCLKFYAEKLIQYCDQPERSKREDICYHVGDINSCWKCEKTNPNIRIKTVNNTNDAVL